MCPFLKEEDVRAIRRNVQKGYRRKDVLAAEGRRTGKKLGMPVANHNRRDKRGDLPAHLHQNHQGCSYSGRCRGLQQNAQGTMVCIRPGVKRMDVCNLHHQQKRHEGEAHQGSQPESKSPGATSMAIIGLKTAQCSISILSIAQPQLANLDAPPSKMVVCF